MAEMCSPTIKAAMNKLSRWAKRAEFKHLLIIIGAGAVGVGTWRAFFDHNSTPVLIFGAALAFAALVSDRLTTAEVAVGNTRAVLGLAVKTSEQNASDLRVAAEKVSQANQADLPEASKRLLLDAVRRVDAVAERSAQQARLLESMSALYPSDSSLGRILQSARGLQMVVPAVTCTSERLPDGWRLTALVTAGPALPFDLVCAVTLADATPLKKNFPAVSTGDTLTLHVPGDFGIANDRIPPGTTTVNWHAVSQGLISNLEDLTIELP